MSKRSNKDILDQIFSAGLSQLQIEIVRDRLNQHISIDSIKYPALAQNFKEYLNVEVNHNTLINFCANKNYRNPDKPYNCSPAYQRYIVEYLLCHDEITINDLKNNFSNEEKRAIFLARQYDTDHHKYADSYPGKYLNVGNTKDGILFGLTLTKSKHPGVLLAIEKRFRDADHIEQWECDPASTSPPKELQGAAYFKSSHQMYILLTEATLEVEYQPYYPAHIDRETFVINSLFFETWDNQSVLERARNTQKSAFFLSSIIEKKLYVYRRAPEFSCKEARNMSNQYIEEEKEEIRKSRSDRHERFQSTGFPADDERTHSIMEGDFKNSSGEEWKPTKRELEVDMIHEASTLCTWSCRSEDGRVSANLIKDRETKIIDFLSKGVSVNAVTPNGNSTVLHFLVQFPREEFGHTDSPAINAILEHPDFDPLIMNGIYYTASELAEACDNPVLAKTLKDVEDNRLKALGKTREQLREEVQTKDKALGRNLAGGENCDYLCMYIDELGTSEGYNALCKRLDEFGALAPFFRGDEPAAPCDPDDWDDEPSRSPS